MLGDVNISLRFELTLSQQEFTIQKFFKRGEAYSSTFIHYWNILITLLLTMTTMRIIVGRRK